LSGAKLRHAKIRDFFVVDEVCRNQFIAHAEVVFVEKLGAKDFRRGVNESAKNFIGTHHLLTISLVHAIRSRSGHCCGAHAEHWQQVA